MITSNDYGLHTTGFSEKWTYKENCFSASSGADSYIAGDINNIIGTPALAAGNCFSGGVDDIRKVGGPSFTYFIPKDSEGTCYNPVTTGSYTEVFALDPNLMILSAVQRILVPAEEGTSSTSSTSSMLVAMLVAITMSLRETSKTWISRSHIC